jgi:hypothetical protein
MPQFLLIQHLPIVFLTNPINHNFLAHSLNHFAFLNFKDLLA